MSLAIVDLRGILRTFNASLGLGISFSRLANRGLLRRRSLDFGYYELNLGIMESFSPQFSQWNPNQPIAKRVL